MTKSLDTPNMLLLGFLKELEDNMPRDLHVLSAIFNETGMELNVTVSNYEQAARAIINFRRFNRIEIVDVEIVETEVEDGVAKVAFTLTAIYKPMYKWAYGDYEEPEEPEITEDESATAEE